MAPTWNVQADKQLRVEERLKDAVKLSKKGIEFRTTNDWDRAAYASAADYGLEVPQVFLACDLKTLPKGRFKPGRRWMALRHQSGGISCHQAQFVGTPLDVRPERWDGLWRLAQKWYGSSVSGEISLETATSYRNDLRELVGEGTGLVDCNSCYRKLKEAYYPMDGNDEAGNWLTYNYAQSLDEVYDLKDKEPLWRFGWKGFYMVLLSENSD